MRSNVPVEVVANDSDRTLRLSSTGRGGCPASSQNASVLRTDGQTVKLMGCKVGDARVRLFSQSDDTRLRTYNFRVLAPVVDTTCQVFDLGVMVAGGTPVEYDGDWSTACRHFRFYVSGDGAHVIADLAGDTSLEFRRTDSRWQTSEVLGRSSGNPEGNRQRHPRRAQRRARLLRLGGALGQSADRRAVEGPGPRRDRPGKGLHPLRSSVGPCRRVPACR